MKRSKFSKVSIILLMMILLFGSTNVIASMLANIEDSKYVEWYGKSNKSKKVNKYINSNKKICNNIEKINTHDDKVAKMQINNTDISTMSTKELINACLEYPMFGDMFFYNNDQEGIEGIIDDFNGLKELFKREDVGRELLDLYNNIDLGIVEQESEYPLLHLKYLETLIAQRKTLDLLNLDERNQLLEICKKRLTEIIDREDDCFNPISTVWIITRILYLDDLSFRKLVDSSKRLKEFEKYGTVNEVTNDEINLVISYINDKM